MTISYYVTFTISVTINQLKPLDQTHPRSSKNPMFDISWMAEVSDFQTSRFPRFQSSADLLLILVSRSDRGTGVETESLVAHRSVIRAARRAG